MRNRRQFLQTSAVSLTSLTALQYAGAASKPNERIRLAVIGVRGRGRGLIRGFSSLKNVEIAYICDPDSNVIPRAVKEIKNQNRVPKTIPDFRDALKDKDVDAIAIATPDHWHALATILGCQAKKHVYVEKPISHNLIEGQKMIEAARKHKRVVQVGTQRRSAAHLKKAVDYIQSGKLGKIPFVKTWIAGNRKPAPAKPNGAVPKGVNYDLWLGPAPKRPFNENHFHYKWHWFWEYGTGELGNNGIHALDLARWLVGLDAPNKISSGGGRYFYGDARVTPDTQVATFDFDKTCLVWEHRFWAKTGNAGAPFGVIVYGEKGTMVVTSKGWHIVDGEKHEEKAVSYELPHLQNFLDCIREGGTPNASIEEGHKSTRLCHLGNIAYRTGHTLQFDAKTETLKGDAQANKLLGRTYRKGFELPREI